MCTKASKPRPWASGTCRSNALRLTNNPTSCAICLLTFSTARPKKGDRIKWQKVGTTTMWRQVHPVCWDWSSSKDLNLSRLASRCQFVLSVLPQIPTQRASARPSSGSPNREATALERLRSICSTCTELRAYPVFDEGPTSWLMIHDLDFHSIPPEWKKIRAGGLRARRKTVLLTSPVALWKVGAFSSSCISLCDFDQCSSVVLHATLIHKEYNTWTCRFLMNQVFEHEVETRKAHHTTRSWYVNY